MPSDRDDPLTPPLEEAVPGEVLPGVLYVVATPIGNLGDLSPRAAAVLRGVDRVLAEDTRRTRILLARCGSRAALERLDAHRERAGVQGWVERLRGGERLALATDAGTPSVSDPGARLAAAVTAGGLRVCPVAGPSAVAAAVSVAGIEGPFAFRGFLPRSGRERSERLARLRDAEETSVFFESPERLVRTLTDLSGVLPADRRVVVCRELTKRHEEVAVGGAGELAARFADGVRGEVTVVVAGGGPRAEAPAAGPDAAAAARRLRDEGISASRTARILEDLWGLSHREAWDLAHADRDDLSL